jgi:hypothetical protein
LSDIEAIQDALEDGNLALENQSENTDGKSDNGYQAAATALSDFIDQLFETEENDSVTGVERPTFTSDFEFSNINDDA